MSTYLDELRALVAKAKPKHDFTSMRGADNTLAELAQAREALDRANDQLHVAARAALREGHSPVLVAGVMQVSVAEVRAL